MLRTVCVLFLALSAAIAAALTSGTSVTTSVDASGALTATVQVPVPPGSGGLAPRVSIQFRSTSSRNSVVGAKFSTSVTSVIMSCPPSIAVDGFAGAVSMEGCAPWCLDGQRLVADASADGVFWPQVEMAGTKSSSRLRVLANFAEANSTVPESWTVTDPKGTVKSYMRVKSTLSADGARMWTLHRVQDTSGNYYTIDYFVDADNSQMLPKAINYTGNDAAGLEPYNSVEFHYAPRSDVAPSFMEGVRTAPTHLLTNVTTHVDGGKVLDFQFEYERACLGGASRLAQVAMCDTDGACASPVVFDWSETCAVAETTTAGPATDVPVDFSAAMSPLAISRMKTGDFDNNGVQDVLWVNGFDSTATPSTVYMNDGLGGWTAAAGPEFMVRGSVSAAGVDLAAIKVTDVNGDGRADIWKIDGTGAPDTVLLSNGDGTFAAPSPTFASIVLTGNVELDAVLLKGLRFGELNADGLIDALVVTVGDTGSSCAVWRQDAAGNWTTLPGPPVTVRDSSTTLTSLDLARVEFLDVNGDSLADVYEINGQDGDVVYLNAGGGAFSADNTMAGPKAIWILDTNVQMASFNVSRQELNDLNGDGLPDLYVLEGWDDTVADSIYLNHGDGTWEYLAGPATPVDGSLTLAQVSRGRVMVQDMTRDGKPDVFVLSGVAGVADTIFVNAAGSCDFSQALDTGSMLLTIAASASEASFDITRLLPGVWSIARGAEVYVVQPGSVTDSVMNNGLETPQLTAVTDGYGKTTKVEYSSLADVAVHASTGVYPAYPVVRNRAASSLVVSALTVANNGRRQTYTYTDNMLHMLGYGSLGFGSHVVYDAATDQTVKTFFSHDFAQQQQQQRVVTETWFGAVRKSRTEKVINTDVLAGADGITIYRLTPVFDNVVVNDAVTGTFMSNQSVARGYDEWFNVLQSTETTQDPYRTYVHTTVRAYVPNVDAWQLFLVDTEHETASVNGGELHVKPTTTFQYDANGNLAQYVERNGTEWARSTTYERDACGNSVKETKRTATEERTRLIEYDARFQFVVNETDAMGFSRQTTWNKQFGSKSSQTDSNGLTTKTEFDSIGRKVRETAADGTTTEYSWAWGDDDQLLSTRVNKLGLPSTSYTNSLKQTVRKSSVGATGDTVFVDQVYDVAGNVVAESLAYFADSELPVWTNKSYDADGRIVQTVDALGGVSKVDYDGLTTTKISAIGHRHVEVYDGKNKLVETIDNIGSKTTFGVTPWGFTSSVVDSAGNTIVTHYDDLCRRVSLQEPDKQDPALFSYDGFDQHISHQTSRGDVITQEFDKLGRKVKQTTPDETFTWEWDTADNGIGRVAVTSTTGTDGHTHVVTSSYDELGREHATTVSVDGTDYVTTKTYDSFSRVEIEVYPGNFGVRHVHNEFGFVTSQQRSLDGFAYWSAPVVDARGQILEMHFGNGNVGHVTYDALGRMVAHDLVSSTGSTLLTQAWEYDAVGNVLSRADGDDSEMFTYDDLNRLVRGDISSDPLNPEVFGYDDIGNMQFSSSAGYFQYSDEFPHQVVAVSGGVMGDVDFEYDSAGHMVSGGGIEFEYSALERPTRVGNATFRFTADHHRYLQQRADGSSTLYLSNDGRGGGGKFEQVSLANGTVQRKYYVGSNIVAEDSGSTFYLHHDHLGSVVAIADDSGAVIERRFFDAFGQRVGDGWARSTTHDVSGVVTPRGFAGLEHVAHGDIIFANGRLYWPALGRFLSVDPQLMSQQLSHSQQLNPYSYVCNNPMSKTDPTGFGWFSHLFKSIGHMFKSLVKAIDKVPMLGTLVQIGIDAAATAICGACSLAVDIVYQAMVDRAEGLSWGQTMEDVGMSAALDGIALSHMSQEAKFFSGGILDGTANVVEGRGSFTAGFLQGSAGATQAIPTKGKSEFSLPHSWDDVVSEAKALKDVGLHTLDHYLAQQGAVWLAHKMGINVDELNVVLEGLSWVGGPRHISHTGNEDQDVASDLGIEQGFTHHQRGIWDSEFDVIDTALVWQGIPSCTEIKLMNYVAQPGNSNKYTGGHSLGALGADLLHQYGFVGHVNLYAMPCIMVGGLPGESFYARGGDFVAGYALSQVIRSDVTYAPGGGHPLCYYSQWTGQAGCS